MVGERKRFSCDRCRSGFTTNWKNSLLRHIKTVHEGIKAHKCDLCEKSYTSGNSLKIHIKSVHEGINDHKCNLCNKAYGSTYGLKYHKNHAH